MSIRTELQAIYDERGLLTSTLVVDQARDDAHPLHTAFEWDDTEAGERYRLIQASQLIRSVRVVYRTNKDGTDRSVRRYVSVMPDDQPDRAYRDIDEVVDDPFARELLLRECRREWDRFKRKYQHLSEFIDIANPKAESA